MLKMTQPLLDPEEAEAEDYEISPKRIQMKKKKETHLPCKRFLYFALVVLYFYVGIITCVLTVDFFCPIFTNRPTSFELFTGVTTILVIAVLIVSILSGGCVLFFYLFDERTFRNSCRFLMYG